MNKASQVKQGGFVCKNCAAEIDVPSAEVRFCFKGIIDFKLFKLSIILDSN